MPSLSGASRILGAIREDRLPTPAIASMEADVAFLDDPEQAKADLVDAGIGEFSPFHEQYGYYAQGVSVNTAILPEGWRERLVVLETGDSMAGNGLCLDPHDCVVAKLVAGRERTMTSLELSSRPG